MAANVRVPVDRLRAATQLVLEGVGLPHHAAAAVADSLVAGDMRGIPSHGVMLLPMYVDRALAGSVTLSTQAEVEHDAGAVAVLDADHAFGQLTGDQAMALATEKAGRLGIGAVTVRRAFHFGGAFRYVQAAAARGQVGVAAANTRPLMPAPGGARQVVGNNPLAIGVPSPHGRPIVLDMALSEAALGKIRLAEQEGREIPSTWATDAEGRPTTDPTAAIAGMLLPAAGPKGFGLAFMVEVLTGVLSGGSYSSGVKGLYADVSVPNDCAHFFLALDPEAFGGHRVFVERVGDLAGIVQESPTAPGVDRVVLPGQLEDERYELAEQEGVPLGEGALASLHDAAEKVGVSLPDIPKATP